MAKLGPNAPASFGDTAYSLPCFYAMTGKKVATVGEANTLERSWPRATLRTLKPSFTPFSTHWSMMPPTRVTKMP